MVADIADIIEGTAANCSLNGEGCIGVFVARCHTGFSLYARRHCEMKHSRIFFELVAGLGFFPRTKRGVG